ncbi:MAG: nitroreductase family protein [Coprobacillus sp.]
MVFLDLVNNRYSCRKYIAKTLDKELVFKCIEAARKAPSACNSQPWKFYVVMDDLKREELVKLTQPFTKNTGFIVVEEKKPNFSEKIVNKMKNQDFTKTDIGIACSYLSLQATELGLATCMIGYFNEDRIKQLLNINAKSRIRLVICIGYPDDSEKHRTDRKEINEIMQVF